MGLFFIKIRVFKGLVIELICREIRGIMMVKIKSVFHAKRTVYNAKIKKNV